MDAIANMLGLKIEEGELDKVEVEFKKTGEYELKHEFISTSTLSLSVHFERYDSYINVLVRGVGTNFKIVTEYLYGRYVQIGGNVAAQQKP